MEIYDVTTKKVTLQSHCAMKCIFFIHMSSNEAKMTQKSNNRGPYKMMQMMNILCKLNSKVPCFAVDCFFNNILKR